MIAKNRPGSAVAAILVLAGMALTSGCAASHSIEPGIWRLKLESEDPLYKIYVQRPRDVEVAVNWSEEQDAVEDVKVQYESRNQGADHPVQRVLGGDIREGIVDLKGYDQDWVLFLKGKIFGPRSMGGTALARDRFGEELFSGTWTLVRTEEAE